MPRLNRTITRKHAVAGAEPRHIDEVLSRKLGRGDAVVVLHICEKGTNARPLPACRQERKFNRLTHGAVYYAALCRLARQERKFDRLRQFVCYSPPNSFTCQTSCQGSKMSALLALLARQTSSSARQAGRGRETPPGKLAASKWIIFPNSPSSPSRRSASRRDSRRRRHRQEF
jgi:hypothetical protein